MLFLQDMLGLLEGILYTCARSCLMECPAAASSGLTKAPTETMEEVVPPGAPTDDRAGPELPAELTKITPCSFTTCSSQCATRHAGMHLLQDN